MRLFAALTPAAIRYSFPGCIVDTREQDPWRPFAGYDSAGTNYDYLPRYRATLKTGDYAVKGLPREAWERKSLADAVGTMAGFERDPNDGKVVYDNWERFGRELDRAVADLDRFTVVIEASRQDILARRYVSKVHPNAILARIDSIVTDWEIPVEWTGTRIEAERMIGWRMLRRWEAHLTTLPLDEALAIVNAGRAKAAPVVDPRDVDEPFPRTVAG